MKYKKKIFIFIAIVGINIVFCGALFKKASIEIDTEKNKVYKVCSVESILNDDVADNYNLCSVAGIITEISKNKKNLVIEDQATKATISVDVSKLKDTVDTMKVSDRVQIYGLVDKKTISKDYIIEADCISSTDYFADTGNTYCLENGCSINKIDLVECSLNEGRIRYYVPKYWKSEKVELNIQDNDLGYVDGYQYILNKTPGSEENEPESFFVCYFKYDGNIQRNTSRSAYKAIEKAIVENIEDTTILKFPTREDKTYYGPRYQYYHGNFSDNIQIKEEVYETEYIFEPNADDGLVMYVYVYKKPAHKNDIIFVTRFLEVI